MWRRSVGRVEIVWRPQVAERTDGARRHRFRYTPRWARPRRPGAPAHGRYWVAAGTTTNPVTGWMCQQARNFLDLQDAGARVRFLLHDRDASFNATFDQLPVSAGIEMIRTGIKTPDRGTRAPGPRRPYLRTPEGRMNTQRAARIFRVGSEGFSVGRRIRHDAGGVRPAVVADPRPR